MQSIGKLVHNGFLWRYNNSFNEPDEKLRAPSPQTCRRLSYLSDAMGALYIYLQF